MGQNGVPDLLSQGLQLSLDDFWERRSAAASPDSTPETLQKLSHDPDWEVREVVASNPRTPPAALTKLSGDPQLVVRRMVASNPNTPSATLSAMCVEAEKEAYAFACRHTSPGTVQTLASICSVAAQNRSCSPGLLDHLSRHSYTSVRQNVAAHPVCPPTVLSELSCDPDPYVRRQVAIHPASPPEAIDRLCQDNHSAVLEALRSRRILLHLG